MLHVNLGRDRDQASGFLMCKECNLRCRDEIRRFVREHLDFAVEIALPLPIRLVPRLVKVVIAQGTR
jgi:hypothetical protein